MNTHIVWRTIIPHKFLAIAVKDGTVLWTQTYNSRKVAVHIGLGGRPGATEAAWARGPLSAQQQSRSVHMFPSHT